MTKKNKVSFDFEGFNKENENKKKLTETLVVLVVGKSYSEALKECQDNNISLRVTKQDGKNFIVTRDYRLDRINVWVENDMVAKATIG